MGLRCPTYLQAVDFIGYYHMGKLDEEIEWCDRSTDKGVSGRRIINHSLKPCPGCGINNRQLKARILSRRFPFLVVHRMR